MISCIKRLRFLVALTTNFLSSLTISSPAAKPQICEAKLTRLSNATGKTFVPPPQLPREMVAHSYNCLQALLDEATFPATCFATTVESRFLRPPRETKIDSRNREFEKSKVASNVAKLLRYCFRRGNHAHFRSNRWEMADLSLAV